MVPLMEIFLSAIIGELTTRCIDFLVSMCSNKRPALDAMEDRLDHLRRVIVNKAIGRWITNLGCDGAHGPMITANVIARMMRDSFNIHFWGKLAAFVRFQFQKHLSRFSEHPYYLMNQNKPVYFGRIHRSEQVVCYHQCHQSSQKGVPKITLHEVTNGDAKLPAGRFHVLAWSSQIPPYYSYINACEIQELKSSTGNKRKRSMKNESTPLLCL